MTRDEIRAAIADAESRGDWDMVRELEEKLVDLLIDGEKE